MSIKCDIAIVGGGLAGASLALALAPLGFDIVVIEAVSFKASTQPSYDDRTLALSHSSCRILNGIGLWTGLMPDATAIRGITVSEPGRPGSVVLDPAEMGLSEFGHVVEARSFGEAVTSELERAQNIAIICPASVTGIETGETHTVLQIQSDGGQSKVQARLVVAADGANSFIRNHLQIPTETRDYGQTAIVCNVTPEQAHKGRAFEYLTANGPFAILPHTGMRCGLVWTAKTEQAEKIMQWDDAEFLDNAQRRFGQQLGEFIKVGRRSAYPLRLVRAKQDIRQRLVILGNAAHAIHPVGAQGFNLALRDVAVLAEILADNQTEDPGDAGLLQQYSHWRRPDQRSTIAYSDGITQLFSHPSFLASAIRTAAILAHALSPRLRRQMANKAMGYRGRVPRLALGEPLSGVPRA